MKDLFSYQASKDDKVFLFWNGKQVEILKGREARTFMAKIIGLDQQGGQLLMAKLTGHFKRGNEREAKENRGR
ncbi:MAG: hypothetical protein EHM45_23855 [Desulfobacteraceae bacterium]|nr:MAG: hypothetical protein EHM45_23855 [Desulfobacteraceae bacterium]